MLNNKCGALYVVATPIGNLQDMSLRAVETLKTVDLIAAEDTRHAARLLNHYSIKKPTLSMHNWNESERVASIITNLQGGKHIALISDAGTPLISDPGYRLIKECRQAGIVIIPIPGPCAAIAALSVAGLPTDKFIFEGFLPAKNDACRNSLMTLRYEKRTLIFYESPHRLLMVLDNLQAVFGGTRQIVIARELTKIHETILSGSITEIIEYYQAAEQKIRGEIVIIVAGSDDTRLSANEKNPQEILAILLEELPLKQSVALAAKITGERKNILYELALQKKKDE